MVGKGDRQSSPFWARGVSLGAFTVSFREGKNFEYIIIMFTDVHNRPIDAN